jgi:hypothetical protein
MLTELQLPGNGAAFKKRVQMMPAAGRLLLFDAIEFAQARDDLMARTARCTNRAYQ